MTRWLPGIGIAMTEPCTGSDLTGISTRAERIGEGAVYVLNGAKTCISNGIYADLVR